MAALDNGATRYYETTMFTFLIIVTSVASATIAALIAQGKGQNILVWFLVGAAFGPLGVIVALLAEKDNSALGREAVAAGTMKKCPACAELIKAEAIKCRYCGTDL